MALKLKIIAQMAVGFVNIDLSETTKRGIYVANAPEVKVVENLFAFFRREKTFNFMNASVADDRD